MIWPDDSDYSGWGRALRARGAVARPLDSADLTAEAPAIGNRRSYGDAPLNSGGRAIDMTALDRILALDRAAGTLTAEAGLTLGTLLRILPRQGFLPPVLPGTGFATLGGAIAMDVHGKNHHGEGSFCQHVSAITLLQNGKRRRITPANKGLWAATCGGLGKMKISMKAEASTPLAAAPATTRSV